MHYAGCLRLNRIGKAKIIIEKDNVSNEYNGNYSVDFIRPPAVGNITLAEITISISNDLFVLSPVCFGLHNGLPIDFGLILRIDSPPYGTLKVAM
jgi:hypothetical protein